MKSINEAIKLFEKAITNSALWPHERAIDKKSSTLHEIDDYRTLLAQKTALKMMMMDHLTILKLVNVVHVKCLVCEKIMEELTIVRNVR